MALSTWTDELDSELLRLAGEGRNNADISRRINRDHASVGRRLRYLESIGKVPVSAAPSIVPRQTPLHVQLGIKTCTYRVPVLATNQYQSNDLDPDYLVGPSNHLFRARVTLAAV